MIKHDKTGICSLCSCLYFPKACQGRVPGWAAFEMSFAMLCKMLRLLCYRWLEIWSDIFKKNKHVWLSYVIMLLHPTWLRWLLMRFFTCFGSQVPRLKMELKKLERLDQEIEPSTFNSRNLMKTLRQSKASSAFEHITKGSLGYLRSMYFSTSLLLGEVAAPFPEIESWEYWIST